MKIYFVRHGITQGNVERKYNGIIDEPLHQQGIEDLKEKRDIYKDIQFDYCYCSPLKRCQQSLDILFPQQKVDELRDDLIEMNFGDWAGITYEQKIKDLFEQGYTWDDFVDPENGETYESLFTRTTNFLTEVLEKHDNNATILVMCHGLVIASIMKKHYLVNDNMYSLSPDNGLGYIVDTTDNSIEKISFE
ncbi:histidine phosphatase family protein [Erysipelotrichaceae bacterium OttesenSCG-928-M19]|nr:histidine phosphatase family protein [Erysipelotrichaceae bacterium OttesenSCG-928-M19]